MGSLVSPQKQRNTALTLAPTSGQPVDGEYVYIYTLFVCKCVCIYIGGGGEYLLAAKGVDQGEG